VCAMMRKIPSVPQMKNMPNVFEVCCCHDLCESGPNKNRTQPRLSHCNGSYCCTWFIPVRLLDQPTGRFGVGVNLEFDGVLANTSIDLAWV
jgi:hypothetical protein